MLPLSVALSGPASQAATHCLLQAALEDTWTITWIRVSYYLVMYLYLQWPQMPSPQFKSIINAQLCMLIWIHACIHRSLHACTCVYLFIYKPTYIDTYVYTYIHANTHSHTHAQTNTIYTIFIHIKPYTRMNILYSSVSQLVGRDPKGARRCSEWVWSECVVR